MKNLINKVLFSLVALISILILGLFIPFAISTIIIIFSEETMISCIQSGGFLLFSVIGIIIAAIRVCDIINIEEKKNNK